MSASLVYKGYIIEKTAGAWVVRQQGDDLPLASFPSKERAKAFIDKKVKDKA